MALNINELPEISTLADNDKVLINNESNGLRRMKTSSLKTFIKGFINLVPFVGSNSDYNQLSTRTYTGTPTLTDGSNYIYLQEDWTNNCVNVGINGKGNIGVNYAKEADSAKALSTTLPVNKGGTGATTFTSGAVLLGNGTGAVTTRAIQNNTAVSAVTANNNLITGNTLAVWNGRYDSSNSKLAYCNKGAFGDMATKTASNYLAKAGGTMTGAINMGGNSLNSVYAIGMYNGARFNSTGGQSLYIAAGNEDDYRLFLGVADSNWVFSPSKDGYLRCGTASYRWGQVYCKSSTISTSDRNQKKEIQPLTEQHLKFFTMLEPVSYKFIDGTSGRTHIGFVSQDVEEAMAKCGLTDLDFAGFCKDQKYENVTLEDGTTEQKIVEGVYIYSLRYEEFIALVTQATQYALDKIETLEDRMNKFEERLASLENVA